jgi:hypothetical protein
MILFYLFIILIFFFILFYNLRKQKTNLPNNLYCFWTGKNPLTENRKRNLRTLKNTGLNVILITPKNLNKYILKDFPLHKGYKYLSETHKSDYLKSYFMNFYGGGHSDIKQIDKSWLNNYNRLKNSNLWGCGYAEKSPSHLGYWKNNNEMKKNFYKIIGNGCYLFKSNTPLTNEWYNKTNNKMDMIYEKLKKYPSKNVRQVYTKEYPYPLKWSELAGQIFHPIVFKYNNKLSKDLPYINMNNYR